MGVCVCKLKQIKNTIKSVHLVVASRKRSCITKGFEKEHSDNIVELSLKYLYRTL